MDQDYFAKLLTAARAGDWTSFEILVGQLVSDGVPRDPSQLADYVRALGDTIVVARAARADLVLTSNRLAAASGFLPPSAV